jgi:hypothetical protein
LISALCWPGWAWRLLAILIGGILVLSIFLKLLMASVSAAIDPQFATTLVREGQSLETIYGLWNPVPVMLVTLAAAALPAGLWWFAAQTGGFPGALRDAILSMPALPGWAMPNLAQSGWAAAAAGAHGIAGLLRRVYTGNGQLYALLVLAYFIVLYLRRAQCWPARHLITSHSRRKAGPVPLSSGH